MAAPSRTVSAQDRERLIVALRDRLAAISDGKLTPEAIDPSSHLFDYGYVDSLSAVTFLAHIEESYGLRIDDVELIESCPTVAGIADRILAGA